MSRLKRVRNVSVVVDLTLYNRLPFIVESVSAVDGSNISGVIEEIGANCAVCSDRHLTATRITLL